MNDQESKCPCKDCITLSICKAIINEYKYIIYIKVRCSLLKEYLKFEEITNDDLTYRYDQIWEIFKMNERNLNG